MPLFIDMGFELIIKSVIEGGKQVEYVRWKDKEGEIYAGLALTYNGLLLRDITDLVNEALLEHEEERSRTRSRYFFVLESVLQEENPPTLLTLWSDNYSVSFDRPNDIAILFKEFKEFGLTMLLRAFNKCSSNPFGRYDNSLNDPEHYFIFNNTKELDVVTRFLQTSDLPAIYTRYTIVDLNGYYQISQTTRDSLRICGLNMEFSTEINQNAIVTSLFPSETTIRNVQNENFSSPEFSQTNRQKTIRTRSTIVTLSTASVLGREISQKAVMNNKSANYIAWQLGLQGQNDNNYEWLHMSAFSFGTPENFKTAQSIDNLILGTSAANSQMLLFETQIQNILRMRGGTKVAVITVVADCVRLEDNLYATWLAHSITYDVRIIDTSTKDETGSSLKKRNRAEFNDDINFTVVFDPFQIISPTVVEQQIVRSLIKELRDDYNAKKQRLNDDSTLITAVHPSLQRLLVRRPSKPVPHQLESVKVNLFGQTNVPVIRETRHQIRLTTVDTPYLVPGDQPFSFAQLFGGVLTSASGLLFDDAKFTVREEDDQIFLEFDGDLIMDPPPDLDPEEDQDLARQALIAFKDLLGSDATLTVGGGLLLKNEITSWENLQTIPDPSYIDLSTAATFTKSLTADNSIVLTNLGLEVNIFRKLNYLSLSADTTVANLPEDWATWVFLSGAIEFHNLNSPEPVVLQAELQYTPENIMVSASVSGVQNLFGLEALCFDFLGAQFVYGQNPEIALRAIYTPFAKSFEFGGIMSSDGVGLYCYAEAFDLNDINDIFNSLTGTELHLPDWDMTFENVRISLATADLVIGPETLSQGLFISATVRIRDYAASVIGKFTPNGVYFEGDLTEGSETLPHAEEVTINSIRLVIDLNKTASDFMFAGEMSYSGLTLDYSMHVEKAGETWNETVYAELHGPSFGLSTLFPSAENTILDTLRFSDAAIIISSYAGTYYKGDTLYNVNQGVQLKCTLEEIPFISTLIHSRQIGLQLSASLGGAVDSLTITMPQSTALQLGNSVRCEPFSIFAYLTPTPNLMLDFGVSLINIPNQDPLRFDLSLDVGVAEAEAAATMSGTIQNFMGITGLNVGPDLGLEVGIIYEQFAVSGIPSELALAAGASYAGTSVDFALKISENPDEEIMYAHVGNVSVNTLVSMIETFIPQIGTVHVPNFLTINDMTLYCAPMGGQIGALKFEPGMNFSASLILGDTAVDILAYFSKNGYTDAAGRQHSAGLYAEGKVQRFTLGPLTVTGLEGRDAEVILDISGDQSKLYVDCAIEFYGMLCGGHLDISNSHISFAAKLVLSDILFIELTGNSQFANGTLTDFQVNGVLHNNFNTYLANLVITKLNQGFAYLEHEIDALQHKVDEADQALNDALDAVNATLADKKADVQAYLHSCQDNLRAAQDHMDGAIEDAMKTVREKKAAFDQTFDAAKQNVQDAQNAFDAAMRTAEANLENKRQEFDAGMITAQKELDKAQGKWDAIVGNAVAAVTAARNKVDGLNRDKIEAEKQVDDSHWYSEGYYEAKLLAIEATIVIADGILSAAIEVLNGIMTSTDNIFTTAQGIFNNTRNDLDSAIRTAETALDAVRQGTEYVALQGMQHALSAIETGADYTVWKAAELTLEGVRKVEQDLVDAAQYAIDNIAETAVYHAFKLAEDIVTAVQNGPLAAAYYAATSALTAASQDLDKMNKFADDLVAAGLEAIYFRSIAIEAMYSNAKAGLFSCDVDLIVLVKEYSIHVALDLSKMEDFAQHIYDIVLSDVK